MLQWKDTVHANHSELQKLNVLLNVLLYKLYEVQLDHRKNTEQLQKQKNKILSNNANLAEDELSVFLSEIEKKQKELSTTYNLTYLSLQGQINVLQPYKTTETVCNTLFSHRKSKKKLQQKQRQIHLLPSRFKGSSQLANVKNQIQPLEIPT